MEIALTPRDRDGAALLAEVRDTISRFVVLPSADALTAVTLWVAATHGGRWFEHATRLAIHSPEKRCGKSRLLEVLEALAHDPVPTSNASVAALFRLIGKAGDGNPPTLMIDEADRLFGSRKADDDNRDLIGLLNNGFRPGQPTWRCVGPQQTATPFANFAFAALAGIGRLPDTIEDRAVNLTMRRRLPGETVARYRLRTDRPALVDLGRRLGEWATSIGESLGEPVADLPTELEDRAQDAWEPLIAIADAARGDWPKLARKAAVALSQELTEDDGERSARLRILADVRAAFTARGAEFLPTGELLNYLRGLEESPWKDYELTARKLARYLLEFRVKPAKNTASTVRGYRIADLDDSFQRYLPSVPSVPSEPPPDKGRRPDGTKLVGRVDPSDDDGTVRPFPLVNPQSGRVGLVGRDMPACSCGADLSTATQRSRGICNRCWVDGRRTA